jgi:DNA repair exonuclease SbcCD ATPase subunit
VDYECEVEIEMSEATVIVKEVEHGLVVLKQRAQSIVVSDAETCREAKIMQRDVRDYMKDVHRKLDPFVDSAKKNLQVARDELNRWIEPAERMDAMVAEKVKAFERAEREAAEAEQRKINEQRRIEATRKAEEDRKERERIAAEDRKAKERELEAARKAGEINKREAEKLRKEAAAEEERERVRAAEQAKISAQNVQAVTVAPSIPTVAGVPSRRNYKARVIDAAKVPDQFWIIDEQALGAEARKIKQVGEIVPGVLFYED